MPSKGNKSNKGNKLVNMMGGGGFGENWGWIYLGVVALVFVVFNILTAEIWMDKREDDPDIDNPGGVYLYNWVIGIVALIIFVIIA